MNSCLFRHQSSKEKRKIQRCHNNIGVIYWVKNDRQFPQQPDCRRKKQNNSSE